MELSTAIREFPDLKKFLRAETMTIFQPILEEVERQDKKLLLFPPVQETLAVKWLVMHPKSTMPPPYYQYLYLVIKAARESGEMELVISERNGGIPDELFLEFFKENPRTEPKVVWDRVNLSWIKFNWDESEEPEEVYEPQEIDDSDHDYEDELGRFSLNAEIKPEVIAKKIVVEARRIYRWQTRFVKFSGNRTFKTRMSARQNKP
jgi:hypothetical protein